MADWLDYWTPGFTRLARDCERLWRRVKIIQEQEREKRKRQKRRERPRMSLFKVKKSPYWQCSITFEGQRIRCRCGQPAVQRVNGVGQGIHAGRRGQ